MYWHRVVEEVVNKNEPNNPFYYVDGDSVSAFMFEVREPKNNFCLKSKYYLGDDYPGIYFTPREKMCMLLFFTEKTNKAVAKKLDLSMRTVEFYLDNMKAKLGCRTKAELIKKVKASDFFSQLDQSDQSMVQEIKKRLQEEQHTPKDQKKKK